MVTADSQRDELHAVKVCNTKYQSNHISTLKKDVPPILGGMGELKESTAPLEAIQTPELWNVHGEERGLYTRTS